MQVYAAGRCENYVVADDLSTVVGAAVVGYAGYDASILGVAVVGATADGAADVSHWAAIHRSWPRF